MEKQVIHTSADPKILLEVSGDLTIKGWDEQEVVAKSASGESLTVDQVEDQVKIACEADCTVRVPYQAKVRVNSLGGNGIIKSLDGPLDIEQVSGDLLLRSVGATRINQVGGDLTAKNINGDFQVDTVKGDATARDVQGDFIVQTEIGGNMVLKDFDGSASAFARGDVTLSFDPSPGNNYRFEAGGNMVCRIPSDASLKIEITRARQVVSKIPGAQQVSPSEGPRVFTLGEGDSELVIAAGGDVVLSDLPRDWEVDDIEVEIGQDFESMAATITDQVTQQIEAQMEMLEHQLESQFGNIANILNTAGLSAQKAERMSERAREASERAQARAQEKLQRAQEKLQRKLESARRRAEMRARTAERAARDRRRRPEPFEWKPPQAETPREPVTDEERMMILQMLEQKKITTEEAEQLLAALEGRSS
ncbi:MAG TPA: hypothetical protein VGA03_07135 [Anaerolineales bacterium]